MNDIYNDDSIAEKGYDYNLMKRLLKYAKPYSSLLLLAIVLMLILTGLELLRPYLIKISIDEYINGYKNPMYEMDISEPFKGIIYNGKKYVRIDSLSSDEIKLLKNYPQKTITKDGDNYYLTDITGEIENSIVLSKEDYQLFRKQDLKGLTKVGILFGITMILAFVFNYFQVYILNYTSQKIIFNIRQDVFSHILRLSMSYYNRNPIGKLVTRVTNDTEALNEMYTGVLVNLLKDIFMLTGIILIMLKMDFKLSLVSFSLLPLIIIASVVFRKKIRKIYRLGRIQLAKINSTLNENISGMNTIHIFSKEEKVLKNFDKINTDYLNTAKREIKTYAVFRPSIEIIRSLGLALLIYYGGGQVISDTIEFGVLYAFIDYLQKFFNPILDLTEKYNILQSAMASSEKIFSVLDENDSIPNSKKPVSKPNFKGKIEFKNVYFAYKDEEWVLKDVSFTINPGETVALVGTTGAGKSSIINLIARFYDVQKGEILIDGINIKDYDKYQLRKNIGIILQDVFLFSGTIKENIILNNKNISDEEVIKISKYINAHHFIDKLPNKYDEIVTERGATLSSGERQLLSFARTLIFQPNILILDEATSNIDTETELLIQDALKKIIKGRTTIAIAHRLSTIQNSDKIIVLHKGRIVEMGNHQELLKNKGLYYDLYKLQYKENFS